MHKGLWIEELPSIFRGYHCTPQSTTKEMPFRLTNCLDTKILLEVCEPSYRKMMFDAQQNFKALFVELDLVEEIRKEARIQVEASKRIVTRKYNSKLKRRNFMASFENKR